MNAVKLKEKKAIENYLEKVKATNTRYVNNGKNNINKEIRATATSHSTEKGYIN